MKAKIIMPLVWVVTLILFLWMLADKLFSPLVCYLLTTLWVIWTVYFLFAMVIILVFGDEEEPKVKVEKEGVFSKISGVVVRFITTQIGGIEDEGDGDK